jgi:hypothetical protein
MYFAAPIMFAMRAPCWCVTGAMFLRTREVRTEYTIHPDQTRPLPIAQTCARVRVLPQVELGSHQNNGNAWCVVRNFRMPLRKLARNLDGSH